jgi:hypothetical protein
MSKVTNIDKVRSANAKRAAKTHGFEGFNICSQDMTICGDCEGNRARKKCPRLKEWLAKRDG